jgi:acetoin:2,6-dichlorophenolindophenol oxidoreductase subunit alpha
VPKQLFDEWEKLDPITRLRSRMLANGWADEADLAEVRAGILREIDEAVEWAEQSPYPDPASLLEDVYERP